MKQVVNEIVPPNVVSVHTVSPEKYYGVDYGVVTYLKSKGFISRENYRSGEYLILCPEEITKGNGFDSHRNFADLSKLIEKINESKFEVYEFDTWEELFAWLMEK
jgi:hypothetical protein